MGGFSTNKLNRKCLMNCFVILMANDNNTNSAKKQADNISLTTQTSDVTDVEWVQIAPNKVIVANQERGWLYQPRSAEDRFSQPMEGVGSIATTRKLLDTAIAVAKYTIQSNVRPPALTAIRWIWRLASAYHLTSPVSKLMEDAAKGFSVNSRNSLAEWALEKAKEEQGHDRLALLDIQSLGYDAEAVVKVLVPPAAVSLVDYLTRSTQDDNPIDCVGYSYTIERLSLGIGGDYIEKIEELLPPHTNATRCLRVHSSVGADANHVDETVLMVAKLTPSERTRVARACYETALMCFSPPPESYISDEQLQQLLKPLRGYL
jgi:hypothetical protein